MAEFNHGFVVTDEFPKAYDTIRNVCRTGALSRLNVTVMATPELHWKIHTVLFDDAKSKLDVQCEGWIEGLRKRLVSDEWFQANMLT